MGGAGYVQVIDPSLYFTPEFLLSTVVPETPQEVWRLLFAEAFTSFSDQFPEEVGLANFLLEIKDLAGLVPKVQQTISKTIAGGFLNWKFNIEPTIRDVSKLVNLTSLISARLKYLMDTRNVPTRLSFRKFDVYVPDATSVYTDDGYGGFKVEYHIEDYKCVFNAGAWLLQDLTHLDDFYGYLRAFAGLTGLNNPLKIVWNALPFSFIADWFGHFSSQVNRFKVQAADGRWDLTGPSASIRQSCNVRVIQVDRVTGAQLGVNLVSFSRYERIVGLPASLIDLPSINTLSTTQLALLGALSIR
jgi:hypothetical protein